MKKNSARLDLHSLEVFHNVVATASFSAAAKAMGLSQPTVSQHVQSLEAALGVALIDRGGRKVRVTAAGRSLDQYAVKLVRLRDEAAAAALAADGAVAGQVAVAASTIPGTYIVPAAIAILLDRHPGVCVEARITDTRDAERLVADEAVELGVTGAAPVDRRVNGKPLMSDELVLVAGRNDPMAQRNERAATIADLSGCRFVMRESGSGSREAVEAELASAGVSKIEVVARLGSTEAVLESVRAGVGVSWVSAMASARDIERGDLVRVKVRGVSVRREIWVVQRRGRMPSPGASGFLKALAEVAAACKPGGQGRA